MYSGNPLLCNYSLVRHCEFCYRLLVLKLDHINFCRLVNRYVPDLLLLNMCAGVRFFVLFPYCRMRKITKLWNVSSNNLSMMKIVHSIAVKREKGRVHWQNALDCGIILLKFVDLHYNISQRTYQRAFYGILAHPIRFFWISYVYTNLSSEICSFSERTCHDQRCMLIFGLIRSLLKKDYYRKKYWI